MAQISTQLDPSRGIKIDEVDANTTYIGISKVAASASAAIWQIRKIVKTGTVTEFLFADGNKRFDNVWDDRASLSYS